MQNPELVEQQYKKLSKDTGFNFIPSESFLDWMGNFCIERNQTNSAIIFFKLAKKYYPLSKNACMSLEKTSLKSVYKKLSD